MFVPLWSDWFNHRSSQFLINFQKPTNIKCPQISKATTAHPSIDYQARFPARLFCVYHSSVALTGRRQNSICDGNIPSDHTGTCTELKCVQIVQVSAGRKPDRGHACVAGSSRISVCVKWPCSLPGNVVFWVLAVIGQSTKQVAFVANQGKTVAKTRTRRGAVLRVFCFQLFPFPSAGLWQKTRSKKVLSVDSVIAETVNTS